MSPLTIPCLPRIICTYSHVQHSLFSLLSFLLTSPHHNKVLEGIQWVQKLLCCSWHFHLDVTSYTERVHITLGIFRRYLLILSPKLRLRSIDRISEYEYGTVLLQNSCTVLFGPFKCYNHQISYFKQIS